MKPFSQTLTLRLGALSLLSGSLLLGLGVQHPAAAVDAMTQPVNSAALLPDSSLIKGYVRTLDGKYLLSPGDKLSISVFNAPEYDQGELTIRPDGYITIKSIGEVKVSGMDVSGLEQMLAARFGRYLRKPEVTVTVQQFHPAILYVLGAVRKPGAYEIHGDMNKPDSTNSVLARGRLTVSNLIANAGGVIETADLTQVVIKNNETGQERRVNLLKMLKEGDISQDVLVHSGDTVMVPAITGAGQMDDETYKMLGSSSLSPGTLNVRVLGKVTTPGVYTLNVQNAGINSAIASAKGYMIEANNKVLKVYRMTPNGQLAAIKVDPFKHDFVLRDNDVVLVEERRVPIGGRGWDYAERIMRPFWYVGRTVNETLDIFDPGRRFPFAN
jgi:polysaccharide export outer membrane protein